MGNCPISVSSSEEQLVLNTLEFAITNQNNDLCREIIQTKFKVNRLLDINQPFKNWKSSRINALGYALIRGSSDIVIDLIEIGDTKVHVTEQQLKAVKTNALQIICKQGNLKTLNYLFPKYLSFKYQHAHRSQKRYSPIQIACKKGHIEVLRYFREYYKYKIAPSDLDIHYVNSDTGYNCALISARTRNLTLIQYLHSGNGADFHRMTNQGECAMALAVLSKRKSNDLYSVIRYLSEIVKVAIPDKLLILEHISKDVREYLIATKSRTEDTLSMSSYKTDRRLEYLDLSSILIGSERVNISESENN